MNVRSVEPMNLIPSGPVLNYSSLHPHIWISNSNVCINHETLLPRKHGHPPHREKHLCVPPTVARCLSAARKPDHTGRENIKTFECWTLFHNGKIYGISPCKLAPQVCSPICKCVWDRNSHSLPCWGTQDLFFQCCCW